MDRHQISSPSLQKLAMLPIFLLTLVLIGGGSSEAQREMLCTPDACLVLHMEPLGFHQAQNRCRHDGGYLVTLRDAQEDEDLRSLLSLIQGQKGFQLWIGLRLRKEDCTLSDRTLRGFRWASGKEDSQYSNWKPEPVHTCTEERCVTVDHSGNNRLSWKAGSCRKKVFYACRFYFQGMCGPLTLLGPGRIVYEAVFSKHPLNSGLTRLPFGTMARIFCGSHESDSSVCYKADGAYSWTRPGPFCSPGSQTCGEHNGGCEHDCSQEGDGVRCSCREGYELDEDGFSCRERDRCRPGTCQHGCVAGEAGFTCTCPSGFQLSDDQRECRDVDECLSQACDQHGCRNTPGGYACVCRDGYRLADGECRDVDECDRSPCPHGCVNNMGSFSCVCRHGFNASADGRFCHDVDECVADPCPPELSCINTDGSFACVAPDDPVTSAAPMDDRGVRFLEPPTRTATELQHRSPHTDAPRSELVNATHGERPSAQVRTSLMICVLGSVIPLLFLVILTLFIVVYRSTRSKKQATKTQKNGTADGYCWVSSGLDPRLEKLYESILTDDL